MIERLTAKQKIEQRLRESADPFLAVHELHIPGVSDNAAATRLSEMARPPRIVVGRIRQGKAFKEWALAERVQPVPQELPL